LRRERTGRVERRDDINPKRDQLRSELGKQIEIAVRRAEFEIDVLPFDIAKLSQAVAQLHPEGFGIHQLSGRCRQRDHCRCGSDHRDPPG
jgi:hypothetical protein